MGLLNPAVELADEDDEGHVVTYSPQLTDTQLHLWDRYSKDIPEVFRLAGSDPVVVICNGDITQGNKYSSSWVSSRISDQLLIAEANMLPWFAYKNLHSVRFTKGTPSHSFGRGSAEILVGRLLQNRFPNRDIQVLQHGLAWVGGVVVDYSHHGPFPGSRNWLRGNVARYYLRDLMYTEIFAGRVPPHLILRAHYHQWVKEVLEVGDYESTLIITPSYCVADDFVFQMVKSVYSITTGMVAVEIINGEIYKIHKLLHTKDLRTKEIILK